ncbi:MAG: integrase core domain-containing protein [Alphaproteobacteria bacterium]|nr:integrase core domain-containing protein [Alphaproteobacteria bacterium]
MKFILFVLPPTKPTYNGKIERSNRVFRKKFYADLCADTIVGASRELTKFLQKYISYRPHTSSHRLTPLEHISKYSSDAHFCSIPVWSGQK